MSIRTILQGIKFDISMMDFVVWSPAAGREMKRLCYKIPKKRGPKKDKQPAHHFNPAFVQQPFQSFQPMQSVPGVPVPPVSTMPQAPQPAHQPYQAQQNPYTSAGQVQQPTNPYGQANSGSSSLSATAAAEKNTRFLAAMGAVEKAWRVPSTVATPAGVEVDVGRKYN